MVNRLAKKAQGEWLLIVADDDLLLPRCIATLLDYSEDADIVYSPPLVWGNDSKHFFGDPPYIPSFGLIYMDLWREIGGYKEDAKREEDRKFWIEALRLGAKFVRADREPTWIYRFSKTADGKFRNKSYNSGLSR
jgi:GT2 family glycosyltransferase